MGSPEFVSWRGRRSGAVRCPVLRLFPFDQFFFVDFDLGVRVRRLWAETGWVFFVLSHTRFILSLDIGPVKYSLRSSDTFF
jgi:hypothetical protein